MKIRNLPKIKFPVFFFFLIFNFLYKNFKVTYNYLNIKCKKNTTMYFITYLKIKIKKISYTHTHTRAHTHSFQAKCWNKKVLSLNAHGPIQQRQAAALQPSSQHPKQPAIRRPH